MKIISSYLSDRAFEASFQVSTATVRGMLLYVAQGGLISVGLFAFHVNDMLAPSHNVELLLRGVYGHNNQAPLDSGACQLPGFIPH